MCLAHLNFVVFLLGVFILPSSLTQASEVAPFGNHGVGVLCRKDNTATLINLEEHRLASLTNKVGITADSRETFWTEIETKLGAFGGHLKALQSHRRGLGNFSSWALSTPSRIHDDSTLLPLKSGCQYEELTEYNPSSKSITKFPASLGMGEGSTWVTELHALLFSYGIEFLGHTGPLLTRHLVQTLLSERPESPVLQSAISRYLEFQKNRALYLSGSMGPLLGSYRASESLIQHQGVSHIGVPFYSIADYDGFDGVYICTVSHRASDLSYETCFQTPEGRKSLIRFEEEGRRTLRLIAKKDSLQIYFQRKRSPGEVGYYRLDLEDRGDGPQLQFRFRENYPSTPKSMIQLSPDWDQVTLEKVSLNSGH